MSAAELQREVSLLCRCPVPPPRVQCSPVYTAAASLFSSVLRMCVSVRGRARARRDSARFQIFLSRLINTPPFLLLLFRESGGGHPVTLVVQNQVLVTARNVSARNMRSKRKVNHQHLQARRRRTHIAGRSRVHWSASAAQQEAGRKSANAKPPTRQQIPQSSPAAWAAPPAAATQITPDPAQTAACR